MSTQTPVEFDGVLLELEAQIARTGRIELNPAAAQMMIKWLRSIEELLRQQNTVLTLLRAEREAEGTHGAEET